MTLPTPSGNVRGRWFRAHEVSVHYYTVVSGLSSQQEYAQAIFILTFDSASGVVRRLMPSGEWSSQQVSGFQTTCIESGVLFETQWVCPGEVIEIHLESKFLQSLPGHNVSTVLALQSLPDASNDAVTSELVGAIRLSCSEERADALLITDNAALIAKRLFLLHATGHASNDRQQLTPEQRHRMDAYIQANIGKSFRMPHLARAMSLSSPHLTALCRNTFQKSPMEYVRVCRLEKAHAMALTGSRRVREIARACGFYDASHLNREFRRHFKNSLRALLKRA